MVITRRVSREQLTADPVRTGCSSVDRLPWACIAPILVHEFPDLALFPLRVNEWRPAIGREAVREETDALAELRPERPVDLGRPRHSCCLWQSRSATAWSRARNRTWRRSLARPTVPTRPPCLGGSDNGIHAAALGRRRRTESREVFVRPGVTRTLLD